ncbi:MAG: molybdopterin molybdotransferase MoeA [Rudaea sp.]|uniref:molybdopterin molybdotransferase MoeA n=1 Tax=unclassified Rudaea TaxID=2627037 RepID=UPI0010F9E73F|nr:MULTISPECIES: gephyrin-like molybdotransferase Glp [unclassified Rudaea]MBN8888158.1 molybdopterin molybdotransferase MoeA [Rudaea sp.]MBR0344232.1 molybdopterin molybdotransferase MoeA [Rudaea sp.]
MQAESPAFQTGLSLAEAQARIVQIAANYTLPSEPVALESALGRILAEDVNAPFDVPGFANSAMDGYALRAADLEPDAETKLRLVGTILAGGSDVPHVNRGTCVRITTGAPLPQGADTVVMKENTRAEGDVIAIAPGTQPGANLRPAGEDYRAGDRALASGAVLGPAQIGVLASFGLTHVAVARKPRVVLLTTGDELVPPGRPLAYGRVHDSNRYSLGALLEQHGADLIRHERLRDDPPALRDALVRAGGEADLVVTSGGVSAGEADYLPTLLAEVGDVHLWKVRIKPGMPFLFGRAGRALVFSLPGNPVSGIATFLAFVRPALDALTRRAGRGPGVYARLTQPVHKTHSRTEFLRAALVCDASGTLHATPLAKQGSGQLRGVAEADALIVLPEAAQEYAAGTIVEALPLPGWT